MSKRKSPFLILLFLLYFSKVSSQITANPSNGCAPLAVNFSGPAGATAIKWTLGSPLDTTSLASPAKLFTSAGTYVITYTAIVGGNKVSYNTQVVVSNPPTGNISFNLPPSHCKPMVVNFNSTSAPGTTLYLDFGDLSPIVPGGSGSHTYITSGHFQPALIISSAAACTNVVMSANFVDVSNPPNLIISSSNGYTGCKSTFSTSINGSSSSSGSPKTSAMTFNWNFNSGTPAGASGVNAGVVTFGQGQHTINLSATDDNKCTGTATAIVMVTTPTLNISFQQTVCVGDSIKANVLSSDPNVYIDLGTGNNLYNVPPMTVTGIPKAIFAPLKGINTGTAVIYPGGSCAAVAKTFTIFGEEVVPDFDLTPKSGCSSPKFSNYINLSASNAGVPLTYTWSVSGVFGMNHILPISSNLTNPTFTLTQGSKNPYVIKKPFVPIITLFAQSTSVAKCVTFITKQIDTLQVPTAFLLLNKRQGCAPLSVEIRDTSFTLMGMNNSPVFPITAYTVYSGSGIPPVSGNSGIFKVTFNYTAAGVYNPSMTIQTANGCKVTSFSETVTVVDPVTPSISVIPNNVCAGALVPLKLTAVPNSSLVEHWHVQTDNNFFSGCVSDSMPTFGFNHVGTHGFTVSAYYKGCKSEAVSTKSITVNGPMASFGHSISCLAGGSKTATFSVLLHDATTATLNFGDNSSVLIAPQNGVYTVSIVHTYSAAGGYPVVLSAFNNITNCISTFSNIIKIRAVKAVITLFTSSSNTIVPVPALPKAITCVNRGTSLTGEKSIDVDKDCPTGGYLWTVQSPGQPPGQPTTSLPATFSVAGIYTVTLKVTDVNMCTDDTTLLFRVSSIVPEFTFSAYPMCLGDKTVQIINNTQSSQVFPDVAASYTIDYGDGTPRVIVNGNPTFSPVYQYPAAGFYTVVIKSKNSLTCEDSISHVLKVSDPIPGLQTSSWVACLPKGPGKQVLFTATPGMATYSISYGDNITPSWLTTTSNNLPHTYTKPGTYTIDLVVVDNDGCMSKESRELFAVGQATPLIKFKDNINKFCPNVLPEVFATVDTNVTSVNSYLWMKNGLTTPNSNKTFQTIYTAGKTIITLKVSTNGFCEAQDTALVFITDPKATFKIDKTKLCLGESINVSLSDTSSVEGWRWFFGDFVPQNTILAVSPFALFNPTLAYTYLSVPGDSVGNVIVQLGYFGLANSCKRTAEIPIQVIKLDAAFKQRDDIYKHCLGYSDVFFSLFRNPGKHTIDHFWTFGDGYGAEVLGPAHTYTAAGIYPVTHKVREHDFGCEHVEVKTMTVFPLPTASLDIQPAIVCPDIPFDLVGSGRPGVSGGLTGTLQPELPFSFDAFLKFVTQTTVQKTSTYTLKVTDENNCESKPDSAVILVPLPAKEVHWDTIIIIGQPANINAYSGSNFTYSWTPLIESLNCINCYDPVSTTTVPLTYTVEISDQPLQCFVSRNTYEIRIDPRVSLDVPSAFSPNGDGVNDIVFPDGWGIRSLIFFKIFNRWGQLVFESNDLKVGWDGTFHGIPQNTETYVYQVMAETFKNVTLSKSGTVKLLR